MRTSGSVGALVGNRQGHPARHECQTLRFRPTGQASNRLFAIPVASFEVQQMFDGINLSIASFNTVTTKEDVCDDARGSNGGRQCVHEELVGSRPFVREIKQHTVQKQGPDGGGEDRTDNGSNIASDCIAYGRDQQQS